MKTGATLLFSAFLAALCGSFVDANGVCYDPNHVGIEAKNAGTVAKDIEAMRSKGFTFVRTYISKFGNTDMVKQIAKAGMQVAAGVPYDEGDYATQLEAALSAAKDGNVLYIMIGNENLARYGAVPDRMIAEIQRVKGLAPPGVKVGTVQRNTEFLNNMPGLTNLISACDVIGVNIHPFFTGGQDGASNAIELTKSHWNKALAMAGDKLILGETGWPSAGQFAGNSGSVASASGYFSAYKAWSTALPAHKKFYFQMFDQPTKHDLFEQTYGIVKADSSDKFGASVPASGPVAVTTPAPSAATTQAPAPTTAAPTATPKPAATNATALSSGSLDNASKTKSAGSAAGSAAGSLTDAGSVADKLTSSSSAATDATTTSDNETGADADATATAGRTTVDTPFVNAKDSTNYAGGKSDTTTDANTQSEGGGDGSTATVLLAVVAGCMAVVAAFGFIYRTRKKAAELEEEENKQSFSITPHGGCVL